MNASRNPAARFTAPTACAAQIPGRIVNISSAAHYRYDGGGAALYAVTKTAVARMTEALAVEWAHYNINVNAIAPGMFTSEMTDGMFARMGGNPAAQLPRKRVGDPPNSIQPCST